MHAVCSREWLEGEQLLHGWQRRRLAEGERVTVSGGGSDCDGNCCGNCGGDCGGDEGDGMARESAAAATRATEWREGEGGGEGGELGAAMAAGASEAQRGCWCW